MKNSKDYVIDYLDFLKTKSLHPIIIFEFIHIDNNIFKKVIKSKKKYNVHDELNKYKNGNIKILGVCVKK